MTRNTALRSKDLMTTHVITTRPDADIMFAVQLLVKNDVSGLPVTDEHGYLQGMLTERDCIRAALQAGYFDETAGKVSQYMSTPVITVEPQTNVLDLASTFAENPYRRYPVVENNRLIGLISRRDILRVLTHGSWFATPINS